MTKKLPEKLGSFDHGSIEMEQAFLDKINELIDYLTPEEAPQERECTEYYQTRGLCKHVVSPQKKEPIDVEALLDEYAGMWHRKQIGGLYSSARMDNIISLLKRNITR